MNVLSTSDLNDDNAPLLRTGVGDDEEFLLATFSDIEIHASSSDPSNDSDAQTLPHNGSRGALFVTTSRVMWIGASLEQRVGYAWEMASVTLHAISRDPAAFPRPCLYCQISHEDVSESAEMNPDEEEDGEDDGWICDEEEVVDGARAAQLAAHFDLMLQVSPELEHCGTELGQFDDAIEESLL
uniref:Chloride conductance regulatory protein ICln n=1 Tax=Hyaloperonospora arabidopsidis (strain Emoy2) TaxID=559515 RepID=M4B3K2_HYAAE